MNTPIRSFRLGDDLWEWLSEKAEKENKSKSAVMRQVLIEEITKEGK